jgi:hypothetical protein
MHTNDIKQFTLTIAMAVPAALHCGAVMADQSIICPAASPTSSAKLDGAAPVLENLGAS